MTFAFAPTPGFFGPTSLTPSLRSPKQPKHSLASTPSATSESKKNGISEFTSQLRDSISEACKVGWDGPGSKIADVAALEAIQLFLSKLPANFPLPEPSITPDGGFLLEWWKGKTVSLSVAINSANQFAFASCVFGNKIHGSFDFSNGELPQEFEVAAKRWWQTK